MTLPSDAPLDLVCLAPLRVEAVAVASGLRSSRAGRAARVVRTGAGGARAAGTARATLAGLVPMPHLPAAVVTGVAGALSLGLAAGHLVVADALVGADGAHLDVDRSAAAGLAGALRAAGLTVRVAPIATSAHLVRGADARNALAAATGALAVDLESQVVAALAWPGPFAVVRAVVDRPEADLLSPATITGGIAALRSLRRAAPVIAAWAAALHPRPLSTAPGPR
jgi:4-hydroxy-3-methylbut-2-enyl diphosphate reductase